MSSTDQSRLIALVDQLRAEWVETEWLEFKEAKHDFGFDDLGKYFSALAKEANFAGRIHNAGSAAQPNWVLSNPASDAKS